MMDVSIVIINYHTARLTTDCIQSIIEHVYGLIYEIILVENSSDEFTEDLIRQKHWDKVVKLVHSKKNLGFAGGNNLGITFASGKYIILLNSDTLLKDNAVLSAFQYMETHPKVGVLSPRLVYPDGRIQCAAQRFPSVRYGLMELFRLQKLLSRKKAGRLLLGAFFDHAETVKADWVWGTFFMFPKKILNELPKGKLDDEFFMYCEDVQWCMDIKRLGYEVHFFSGAEVIHLMGGSSVSNEKTSAVTKDDLIKKHHEMLLKRNYPTWKVLFIKMINRLLIK